MWEDSFASLRHLFFISCSCFLFSCPFLVRSLLAYNQSLSHISVWALPCGQSRNPEGGSQLVLCLQKTQQDADAGPRSEYRIAKAGESFWLKWIPCQSPARFWEIIWQCYNKSLKTSCIVYTAIPVLGLCLQRGVLSEEKASFVETGVSVPCVPLMHNSGTITSLLLEE